MPSRALSRLMIVSYVRDSGVVKPGSRHLFRHTMATLMLEGGADIRYVQQMLGHADTSSAQTYTRVLLRKLEAVHSASHPGAADAALPLRVARPDTPVRPSASQLGSRSPDT